MGKIYSGPVPRIHFRPDDISFFKHSGIKFGKKGQILKSTWIIDVRYREKATAYSPAGWSYSIGQLSDLIIPMNCIISAGDGFKTKTEAVKAMYEARDAIHKHACEKYKAYKEKGLV